MLQSGSEIYTSGDTGVERYRLAKAMQPSIVLHFDPLAGLGILATVLNALMPRKGCFTPSVPKFVGYHRQQTAVLGPQRGAVYLKPRLIMVDKSKSDIAK
ncbi:hypothetical protein SCUP234_11192 [Seiridium cupressi]